ncbi:hypothetical protein DCAR_0416186 [Daucus carota subsp. sativus]|uniref:Uncharacterized protein n=1 Tax=Daucus carota subsp. sativus TaxID=79200 RepID=A0A165X8G6_DAUCS|nr:hypothetical protein DCAR_0416186 [Daucus carota subsp. sativus]
MCIHIFWFSGYIELRSFAISSISNPISTIRIQQLLHKFFPDAVGEIVKIGCADELRRITRSYYKKLGRRM